MAGRPKLQPGEVRDPKPQQQADGTWSVRAHTRDAGGVRRYIRATGATTEEAVANLHARARQLAHETESVTTQTELRVLLDAWIEEKSSDGVRPQTVRAYRDTVRWLAPLAGALTVEQLTPQRLTTLFKTIEHERSASAVDRARVALNGALLVAVSEGAIHHNPMLSLRRRKKKRKIPTTLTVTQVNMLRRLVKERAERNVRFVGISAWALHRHMEVALGSGLRIGEVTALRNTDVDLDAGTISVDGVTIDDEDWRSVRQEGLKALEQARTIHLPAFAVTALRDARTDQQTVTERLPDAPAIPSRRGTAAQPRNLRRTLREIRVREDMVGALGETGLVPTDLTPHIFRRTAATLAAAAAGDLTAAQKLLGHADVRTTRQAYAGLAYRAVGSAEILEELLGAGA